MNCKNYIIFLLSGLICLKAYCQDFSNIQFVENKGQWNRAVKYMGQVSNGAFFVTGNGFTILQHNGDDLNNLHEITHNQKISTSDFKTGSSKNNITIHSHAYSVSFLNGNPNAEIVADKPLEGDINYFIGNDPSKWASNCKVYQGITVKNVYPNVDVRYFSDKGTVKYDIIVNPGGNISDIALKYDGVDKLDVKNKELVIRTSVGNLKELEPYTYQYNEKGRNEIGNKYKVKDHIVRFNIKDYDPTTTLIIDPTLVFCSFTGSTADNWGFTATYGPDGSMYGGGIVFGGGFPVSNGAFQTSFGEGSSNGFGNGFDIGLIKLSPDGRTRVYATYLGGTGNEFPQSLIVDNQGELIVAGRSESLNFPITGPKVIGSGGSFDIIVTKLNATGSALVGSVKLGGSGDDGANITAYGGGAKSLQRNYGDEARSEVNLDAAGNIYVASCTQSNAGTTIDDGFPIVNGFQQKNSGGTYNQDGVVLKFNPTLSTLLFSTFLGGSGNDAAYVLTVDPFSGNIYVAGGTESSDFPGVPASGVISSVNNGGIDGFVTIISNDGSRLIKSTYVGTSDIDQVYGIQIDKFGFPYIMGQTSGEWPIQNATYSVNHGRQFIAKLKKDLSAFVYSTVFGTGSSSKSPNISPVAFLVDRCENVYVSGWGGMIGQIDYPSAGTQGLPVTADALKPTTDVNEDGLGEDFYFFVLKRDATAQLYGSFFGQNGGLVDHVDGGTSRFDRNGVIYEAICANCGGRARFPTTPNAWAKSKPASANCNLAMVKIAFNLSGVRGGVLSSIDGRFRDTSGCIPLKVDFVDTIQIAKRYYWNFGDGTPQETTTIPNNSHTYTNVGVYRVMMIAIDSNSCNISDTSYVNIKAGNLKALLSFTPAKLNPCDSFKYEFINTSIAPASRPFTATSFGWDFGDGTVIINAGTETVFHNYASPGTYNVKLILHDPVYCNDPDTITTTLRVAVLVKARIQTPPYGCIPYNAVFENTSDAGSQFFWDFGDGTTSTDVSPTHLYNLPGTYKITLLAIDTATCNKSDSTSTTIQVFSAPTANFTAAPQPPVTNVPISFTNLSSADAVSFKWLFDDGDSLITNSRSVVDHEFNSTATFNVCLIATNRAGCEAMYCAPIVTLIEPALDVPNAFTPLRGDNNIIYVRGFGFAKMKFTIYDRWGHEVFVSTNKHIGWDGKYKGQLLPMDVYAYTLSVEFTNGTKTTKTGDITLIR